MDSPARRALLSALCLLAGLGAAGRAHAAPPAAAPQTGAQAAGLGSLAAETRAPAGVALPLGAAPALAAALTALRDAVYDDLAPPQVLALGAQAAALAAPSGPDGGGLGPGIRELALSRIDYYCGRLLNEYGDKQQGIQRFEASLAGARKAGAGTPALLAEAQTLSQLCAIKDIVFLVANGPKVLQIAQKILDTEQNEVGAALIQAQSKAFAPAVFGGDPAKTLSILDGLVAARPQGLEKDQLFDLRVCRATALEKLGRKDEAAAAYRAALELYPGNRYARESLGKLGR